MGWLWNNIHDLFDTDDGTFPEICVCNLKGKNVVEGYNYIRKHASMVVGAPRFLNGETNNEMGIDEVEDASLLVANRKAHPFHFMVRDILFEGYRIRELGVFILDNAIALDYEKGPLWGEIEIESLLCLIIKLMPEQAHLKLEESVSEDDLKRLNSAIERLKSEQSECNE